MKITPRTAIVILCSFFVVVFSVALSLNPYFPVLVFAGEDSVGTWMSGAILIFIAALCLFISMTRHGYPWILLSLFFLLLALDERFMYHERIKEWIIFSSGTTSRWVYELPVILGAGIGIFAAFLLWQNVSGKSRGLLVAAVIFGLASVVIDVLAAGILWEECFKLFAELLLACALLIRVT
jgi:hypothetical protein